MQTYVYDFSYEQKAAVWMCVMYQFVLHFGIVLEVKVPCSTPEAKATQKLCS